MLHVTTTVGEPGAQERERRHFPSLTNCRSKPVYKLRGRRYIPHGNSEEIQFCPHPQHVEPVYEEGGLDWTSRLRYIPSPHNEENCAELWPENWKNIRTFPWMSRKTDKEWAMYPEGADVTLRCHWDGEHKATANSLTEITHKQRFGRGRIVLDKRNGIPFAAPGDKNYQVVESSQNFHKLGCTLPIVNFGGTGKRKPDTFVPLLQSQQPVKESWWQKQNTQQRLEEQEDVKALEHWKPASPLLPPPPSYLHPPLPHHTEQAPAATRVV